MSWSAGSNGYTWSTGNGIRKKSVVGPCRCLLPSGATHAIRYNDLGNVMGIEWIKKTRYAAGHFSVANGFQHVAVIDQATYDNCWGAIGCTSSRPEVGPPPAPIEDPTSSGWSSTSITENIDWRIAGAVALVVIIVISYLITRK